MDSKPKPAKGEIGQSGTYIINGIISGEEFNRKLTGRLAINMYDKMRRSDPTVAAILRAVKYPIMSADFTIDAAKADENDDAQQAIYDEQAAHIKYNLFDVLNWHEVVRTAFTMFDFGFEVMEKVYDLDESTGLWVVKKLAHRKQSSIQYWQTKDKQPGVQQLTLGSTSELSIPMEKLVVFTNDKEGENYEGISMLRAAYMPYYFKTSLIKVQAIGLEKQSVGVPFVKPPAATPDAKDLLAARAGAANMRANESSFVEIPFGWEIGFMDMGSGKVTDPTAAISYHDRQIAKSVLAQFIDLGSADAGGSRALSEDQTRLFSLSLEAAARNFVDTLNEQLVKQLVDLNWTVDKYPKINFSKIGDDNITVLAEALSKLAAAKIITPTVDTEQRVRTIMHMPELDQDEVDNYDELHNPAVPEPVISDNPDDPTPPADPVKPDPNGDPEKDHKKKADALIQEAKELQNRLIMSMDGIHARRKSSIT